MPWSTWTKEEKVSAASLVVSVVALVVSLAGGYLTWQQADRSFQQSAESLKLSKETVENEYRKPAKMTISVGRDLFLAAKPYVGVTLSVHNSGAQPGVIVRGTLTFGTYPLDLVMMSPQTESWTYGPKRDEIPMRFSYFSPITIEKSASISSVLWFQKDMGNTHLFTAGTHPLELQLFDDSNTAAVATKRFGVTLSDSNVAFIYRKGNETTQLPVVVNF